MRVQAGGIVLGGLLLVTTGCGAARPVTLAPQAAPTSPAPTATSTAAASACRSTLRAGNESVIIDWVDFVRLNGVEYLAGLDGVIAAPHSGDIGTVVGSVRCQLSTLAYNQEPGPSADGDAAFLPVGTQVRAARGFAPACRVVARYNGAYRVYLAHHNVNQRSEPVPCAKAPARTN